MPEPGGELGRRPRLKSPAVRLRTWSALAIALVALAGAAAAESHGRVVLRAGLLYRPSEFAVSGDGDFAVRNLRWQSWGGKRAVAYGQAIEQERPSHRDFFYPVRVTASRRVYCPSLHRTVYNKVVARLLSRGKGVFGVRTLGRVSTCSGSWRLIG